jgi:hypothetical protein
VGNLNGQPWGILSGRSEGDHEFLDKQRKKTSDTSDMLHILNAIIYRGCLDASGTADISKTCHYPPTGAVWIIEGS